MAVNPPATWLLSQPCPCQTDTWSMAYLPAQRRPLTTHLSGRSLISRLNPFLDPKPLSPVTGIFHKKLSLGRIKLKNSLFPLKRKKNNKTPITVLKIWPHRIKRKKYCAITESQQIFEQLRSGSSHPISDTSVWRSPALAWGRRAPEAHGPAWGDTPSLHIADRMQHRGGSTPLNLINRVRVSHSFLRLHFRFVALLKARIYCNLCIMQYTPRRYPEEKDVHHETHTPPPMPCYFHTPSSTQDAGRGENAGQGEETRGSGSAGGSSRAPPALSSAQ